MFNDSSIELLSVRAQAPGAVVAGSVIDEHNATIADAAIIIRNLDNGVISSATSNNSGYFTITAPRPGRYNVTLRHPGFTTLEFKDLVLNVNDQRSLAVQMKVGRIEETVVVEAARLIQTESSVVSTLIDRQFVENLPLNGRSINPLIELTPGAVVARTDYGNQGQFSVNGQRTNANYYMIDGLSANVGVAGGVALNQSAGGSFPAFNALGGTSNLVSIDALQEFRIQTSTYAAEFGRTPGAQISIATRSGTNKFHGTAFDYVRNDAFDANDWFANSRGLKKPPLRQNDFGGVFGGPVIKDRTFFFFSYEGLRLRQPQVLLQAAPSASTRELVPEGLKPFFNAFPIPNGRDLGNGFAEFSASYANRSTLDATAIRIDQFFGQKFSLFGRFNYAPSEQINRGGEGEARTSLSTISLLPYKTRTLSIGATATLSSRISNDFRINQSLSKAASSFSLDNFGGAHPLTASEISPGQDGKNFFYAFGLGPASFLYGKNANNSQQQVNVIDNVSLSIGAHQFKFGVDYRRLLVTPEIWKNAQLVFTDLTTALRGNAQFVVVAANAVSKIITFTNFSAYSQDQWKATSRLAVNYGVRWELNPPPVARNGNFLQTAVGFDNPATATLAPPGTPLWRTRYTNFAPRLGVSYLLSPSPARETVIRGGFGIFYDLLTGVAGGASAPVINQNFFPNVPYPLDPVKATPPSGTGPIGVVAYDPHLTLPLTYQWNVSAEQALGTHQSITASYVAAAGRRLARREILEINNATLRTIDVTRNLAASDYHSLQLQYQRRLLQGLQVQASYTWSHSIDNDSSDLVIVPRASAADPRNDRGPSDFDVRHSFSTAATYDFSMRNRNRLLNAVMRNWSVDTIFRARSALPINVATGVRLFGAFNEGRPDLIPGVPLYVQDASVGGGRRINRAAFSIPPINPNFTATRQGTLGRNSLRGFPLSQWDLALRRKIHLGEGVNLQLRGEVFNLLNHPNFGDPENFLDSGDLFGRSSHMFGSSFGSGANSGAISPLYQIGGSRSIQLALKLLF